MMNFRSILVCSAIALFCLGKARALTTMHVPHDIIYSLDVSPTFGEDGLVFASSTQFGEAHLMSSNYGETFSESHAGMQRTLVTGHTFSPNYAENGTVYMVTKAGYYKSTDRGQNWEKQSQFPNEEVLSICFAENGEDIYVMTRNSLSLIGGIGFQPVKQFETVQQTNKNQQANKPSNEKAESNNASNNAKRQAGSLSHLIFGKLQLAGGKLYVHRVSHDKPKKETAWNWLITHRERLMC